MLKLEEKNEIGKSRLEQLKHNTFFSEMELRALFNEYKPFTDDMDRKNYISQSAFRLKRKFEKLMQTLKVLQEILKIDFDSYETPVQNSFKEIHHFWLEVLAKLATEKTEDLSINEIIAKNVYWQHVFFKRKETEQIEFIEKWAEQVVKQFTTDVLVKVVNVYLSFLDDKARQENKEYAFIWTRFALPYLILLDDEEEIEENEKTTPE